MEQNNIIIQNKPGEISLTICLFKLKLKANTRLIDIPKTTIVEIICFVRNSLNISFQIKNLKF